MPYNRPGNIAYVTNTAAGTLAHGIPALLNGIPGITIKQRYAGSSGLAQAARDLIQPSEKCALIAKGIVEVALTGKSVGDPIYIAKAAATNSGVSTFALSATNDNTTVPFGVVTEVPTSGRGVPTGKVRISLDLRDTLTNAEA